MTRPRMLHPRGTPHAPPSMAEATADVHRYRNEIEHLRRLVARNEAGAAELALADYRLQNALRRLDAARASDYPPDAA